jgi:hypothetical protein
MIRLQTCPLFLPSPVSNLSHFLSLPVCRRSSLLTGAVAGGGAGGGQGAKSFDRKEAWPSTNQSTLSGKYSLVTDLLDPPRQENILLYRTK